MERMNHLKRVMAWVMTAAMLVSSCPTTAIADEVVSQVQKPVAQTLRSGETYGSLQEAYEAEFETTTDETHMSFADRVRDVEKNGKDTLIYANLRPAQNAAQWKTGEVVPFTLSMTFQLATNLTEYRAFDLNSMTFDEYIRYRPFDSYDDIKLQISAPGNLRISATDNGGWTDILNVDSVQSVVPADGSNAVTLNYTFFGRMIDNGEHANGDLITPTVSLSASITPKMHYYDKNGEEKVYAGTPIDYQATIHTNAFQNAAKAKTWAVQNEAEKRTVNGDEVTFTYQVRTGALGTQGEILRQNSDYVDKGVLDLSSYTLQETIQPVEGKNGAKVYPKQATVTLGDSAYTCDIVENEDGTRSLVMPANGGNTIHNTAALDGDNTVHPSVYAYNNYTVNLIYDKADFELDCDDERLDDAAFKGLGVTLDSTLNYTVYGDSDEKTADSSKTLYYHFVRQGGYILPEQYVKLAADVADRTAYSGSDAVFAIYKASEVKRNEKGELVLGENAKLSDRIGAFKTSRELPEGDYYVVRTGMEAGYTNVKPGDKKTIKIGEAFYPYQLVAVTAGAEEKAVKAEFEDYNAQNGQFILEKMFYAPDGTQNTNSSLSAEFTLTGQNGRTYTVKVENGKPTTVYLPADTYTMKETGVSDGFVKADDRTVVIEAGRQTRMTDENAVKNYSTEGLLNLKAYLRKYEQGANLEADQSHYTVTITRGDETEPVKQTTLDEAEPVYLPRFDGDGRLITYRVKVQSNEQTGGLFYASSKNGEEEKPEAEIQITFTDDARIQNADYFFIKQQELTITKRLVDVSGLNKEQTWTITVQAACEAGDALPSRTVKLTTDGKQNEASQTLSLRGWDENGHVVTYTVGEAAAEGYAVTYSEERVTLDDGTDKTITVTNTRQVGKTTFTKEGSDNATLPDAVYAVLTRKADGKTYLVGRTPTDGVLTGKTEAIVDEEGRLTQPENVAEAYRFTTDADGRIELVLPVEEGTSYYLQELAAPENYYLNTELVWLTVAAGDDSQKAGQVDRRKYQLEVTKVFPDEVANGSFATFTLYDENKRQVGEPVTVRKPDQAVGVFTIPAYGKYFVRETAVSGDMMLNDSVFGPLTYSETDQAENLTVPNKANVGSLTVELRDEKKKKLGTQPAAIDYVNAADLAKFTVSVDASNLAKDSYAYRALLGTGFVLDETTNTLVYTGKKGARQAFELSSLPIYGDPNDKTTALTYTVKQEQAAQRYFKAEDGQQFKLDENASQTLTFENEPRAALNVSLNYQKEYELERGNAPEYPLTGATMTLYEVKDDGTLEQVESFNMTNPTATISDLHGLKHYVLVETEVPDGYCAYESKDQVHAHSDNAAYNREPHDYQDVLDNFNYVELTGKETDNQNDSQSSITNYKDYVQLKLNKSGYMVQFEDGAATEGVVVGETQSLDYCQFEVYAIRTSDLTEPQRKLLARNSAFIAPQAGKTVEKGTYTGREAELEAIFTAEPQKSKLITDGITYETGASGMGTGAFMTDAFELGDDVGKYTFLFREVKINHAGGYQKVYGGVWSAAATEVNAVTEVDAYNEADVVSGGETEFKGLFQVKLDKEYWPSTEAKDNNRVGELKPLAGVTFELLLARENANGLLEAVKGSGAFSTEFVTGCESGMSAGYGVSITVSLETLYTKNGGADNPDNPVKLDKDENGQPFYEADFILREKDYPINMVYMQERYALHVKAVKNAQDADYVTVVDDYLNKDGQRNSIKNILGEMTYLTVAKYVDGERYYGGEGSTDAVYTITDAKGEVYTHVTLNNANHYETTVQLPRQTTFTIEETTAPVIEGVQTDKSGFVFDGEKVNGTSANRLTFTTGEYKSQIAVCSTNTRFHSLTVIKRDADEKLVEGAPIQIGYSDGESAVLSSNGSPLAHTRQNTNEKGEVIFSLPIWDYRTSEAGNYPKAEYAIAEALVETPVAEYWNPNAVVNRYFKLLNGGKLTIAGADVKADEPITVYNPATTSVTLHKVSDRSGDTADLKPIAAHFALYFCPFKSQDEFEGKSNYPLNYPQIGYVYLPCTGTTDAKTGEITFDGLYSGWYKLVETIPQGQVNAGQLFTTWFRVICDEDYKHLDKSGKSKSYTSEVQLLASATLKNRSDAGRQDANNSVTIIDHTIDVTNTPRAYLEITKTFEPSQTQSIPESVAIYVYKKGTTEAAELEMRVVDAHGTESWQKVAQQPITLGGFTETKRSQSIVVRLDPGAYTVVESTDESAGYWFAKSAAYQNGNPETTPVYNGTTVANNRITSSRDVTVTRYNAMDVQHQMKVDFVNAGTLMAGQIEKTKCLSESETPTALENCFFSLYTLDKQNNKRYYVGRENGTPFGDWTGARENAVRFKSGADGMVQLNEVYAPEDAMTDGTVYTYYVEEISAPDYSYQLAYDAEIGLTAGSAADTVSMVNTRGVSIQVRVFGSVRINRNDDTPVVEGAVLHIMKKDADGGLHEVLLSDGQPYLYQTVTSDANGDVLFPYLPRLEEGEAYVVFEQPDAGAIGDDPDKPYLNPVSRGYKAYYDFKKTDANHSMAEQDVSELDGAAGYYTVVTGEELMANPNELFSTLHFNAYNEPKGRLVILKRDYENKSALVGGAKFSAAETDGTDETHRYAFANLEPTAEDRTEAPQTLEIGEKTYTLAKDRTYYTDGEYRYTYVITSYVEHGSYAFAETTTPAGYIETEASQSAGMPWHTEAEAKLTNKGGFAAAAFANIPNRDPYLDKTVSAVNGEAGGKLGNLQNTQADGSWQTVTFEIRKTTSDSGAEDANDAIRYPMSRFVITDNKVEYQTVDAHGNKNGWLDGDEETVQTQHFVESVTVGKMSFAQLEEAYGTAAKGDKIYADVYGLIGTQETLIRSNIDVTGSRADVSLKAEDGGCIYTGFKIAYHMKDSRDIPAGLRQDTPIAVTMRFHQESGEAIDRVCGVRNTAGLKLAYAIGAKSQESVSKTYTDAANCDADSSIGLPKARITKQVQRAEIVQNPNTGDYVVTVEAEATNHKSDSLTVSAGSGAHYTIVFENIPGQAENLPAIEAPILVDTLPRQAMAVKAEARSDNAALKLTTTVSQDGYTVVVRGDGRLEAGQKITLTVDALFVGERILEQIIAHNTGMDANIAYAMSGVQTVKNTKNPFGVPFVDEAGNEITGMVKQQPGDSQSGELPGFEGQHGISAKAEHRSAEPSALTISKYVAGTITGKNKFVSGSNVAVTGAKTEKDNEINRIYYRILVENPSLSPAASVAVMDELPHTDDWRNDSSTRDSKWDVALESTAISVTKYAADGSSTELKPGEDYTVYFTKEKITSENRNTYNDYFGADNIRKSWATSMAPADVHGFAVMLTQPLAAKERVLIEYTCSAPEVTDSSVYFTTANNIARLSYDQHSGVASDVTRVAIIPEKVWLGNRVWIDFNGDGIQSKDLSVEPNYAYTGEGKQLTMQLSQRYNRYRPTTQTQTITDGSYQFDELFAAVKLASLKNDPNDSAGNVVATNLSGSERYTYQLALSGIPKSFMVTRKGVNNPIASDKDSDFVADGNGSAATKWFYLPVPTEEMVKNDQLGYQQVDVGLVPVRDLKITKKANNGADVSDAVFAIYGPYTTDELDNLTAVSAAKKVGKMTSSGNVYSFVSTQSAYLTYADSYLVVETSAPAPYLSTGATFSGEGIAAHGEVEIGGEKHSCFVLEGMNTLPGDFKADSRKTYCVNATDLYSAAGTYMLTAQKKVFAEGTQVELERYANLFRIWVTSPDDPNLTKRVAVGGNVTVEENAVFVQADENGKFDLTMNYATIPETGWTQRDWEGMTYTYQIEEVDTAFDGVTYDKTKYTVTVTLEDDGQGHLTPKAEISGGEDGSIVLKNKLARRDLTISKTTAGNAVLSGDAFTVKIRLSRNDIVPVDGDYPMDGAAETKLTVKNGEATLTIRDGQTVTIKDIPVGTTYTVEETDERAQGYNIDASAFTSGGSGVIATEAKVELKNVRNAGSLEIRKKIEGKDPISEREFSFTAAITYPADVDLEDADNLPKIPMGSQMTVQDRTVTIKDIRIAVSQTKPDVNVTIGNILYGASYTVTENDGFAEWGYAAYYDEDMKFGESTPNRVVNAENQTALFTNVRSAGKLKIGKTATGTGVGKGLAAGTETYNVKLTLVNETVSLEGHVGRSNMPSEGEKTTYPVKQEQVGQEVTLRLNLHNGEVVTFEDLPEGTSYAVVEDEQPYRNMGFTVSYADGNSSTTEKNKGTISKETASSVQITNVRDTHSVSITKNVLGQMANEDDAFDFNVRIEKKDDALSDEAVYREYTYTVNGRTETIDFRRRDVQTISLKKGETAVIDDVPDGADIIVTEAMSEKHEDEGYTLKTTQKEINEKPNIIGYTFTNERYIGSIEITKALAGTGSDKGYGKTFTFDVKLWNERNLDLLNAQTSTMPSGVDGLTKTNEQRDGHDVYAGTVSITMGTDGQPVSASITNIPAHTCYEIVERDYTDDGYTTQAPQNASGLIDVVNEAGREEAMTFTNTRESGTLALSKALKGNATDGEKAFTFHVKLENARFDTATQRDAYDVVIREANKADVQTTVARDANGEYVLTLKGGQTATLLDVLYGTTATVAEDDYTAEGYEAVSTQTAAVNGQTPDAAAAFTNERNVGVLSVTKNAVGNAVKFEKNGRAVFSFSATLTYADWIDLTQTNNLPTVDGKTPKNMTVDAKNHTVTLSLSIPVTEAARVGSLTVENILKGTRYAVREVFDAQDGYYLTVSTQNGRVNGSEVTGTIADALTGDAVFTNTRNVGALEITKKLEGTGYNDRVAVSNAVRTSFGFTVRLWREDGVRLTGDNRPTLNGKALTLETRTENGFTYDEAHVTVDMADGAAATGEERGVTIGNILADTHYTVIEDENGYQTEGYVVRQGEQGGVMTDAGDTLRFVNTRDTGSLEIVKNLDGRTAEFGREFEFTVTLSRNDNIALAGAYLTQSGRTVAFEDNAAGGVTARVRVAGGGSLTILGIPSGTSYTVSEADYTADRYTTTSTGAVGVVETAAVRATFLNTRANPGYGALTVTKTVEAIGGAEIPDTQFVFDIALTLEDGEDFTGTLRTTRTSGETGRLYFNGGAASIRLSHGESVTLSGIPLGTSYTVTERAAQDMRVSSTGSEGAIKGTGHMAAFVNTMTQAYTDLIVRKAWNDANDAQKLRPQSVTVDVTRNGQTITTLTLNAANRWTQTLTQLPMVDDNGEAYDYDVVENDVPEGYTASVVTRGTTFTVINTHRIDDGFVPVDPENRRRGGLTILDDLGVPLGGGINMNEGDCFN